MRGTVLAFVALLALAASVKCAAFNGHTDPPRPNKALETLPLSPDLLTLAQSVRADVERGGVGKAQGEEKLREVLQALQHMPQVAEFTRVLDELRADMAKLNTTKRYLDPDTFRTICEVIVSKGFNCESHTVVTEDGYLLEVFRVYKGSFVGKKPVLLSHGLLDTAFSWVLNSPSDSLGYILADQGYDVWLGNSRGNIYGMGHVRYGQFDKELWDFSFDQQAIHDVPSTVDYILNRTSNSQIAIVGHSQGCAQLFGAVQHDDQFAKKISVFIALAPAGYFDHLTNWLIRLGAGFYLADLLQLVGVDKFLYIAESVENALPYLCDWFPDVVEYLLSLVMGSNPGEINLDRLEVACYQSLGWTSVMNMVHWSQLVRDHRFQLYDFGFFGNREAYGGLGRPPLYDIARTWPSTLPVAVFYGGHDDLVPAGDAEQIIEDLGRAAVFTKKIDAYAHLDFTWGKTAYIQIYNETVSLIKRYH